MRKRYFNHDPERTVMMRRCMHRSPRLWPRHRLRRKNRTQVKQAIAAEETLQSAFDKLIGGF